MDTENPILFAKKMGAKCPLAVASEELKLKFGGIEAPIQFEVRAALCDSKTAERWIAPNMLA
jgi:hypothetical protein